MPDPTLAVRLPVQPRALDEKVPVPGVKIDGPHRRRAITDRVRVTHALEKRRGDQVDILSRVGEKARHHKGDEAARGAGVVVSRKPAEGVVEERRDVGVGSLGREGGAAGIVVEVDG